MKKLLCIIVTAVLLLSCAASFAEQTEPDFMTGTPWPLIDVAGVVTEDTPAVLKDNFALYVNKDRLLAMEIPEGEYSTGTMSELQTFLQQDLLKLLLGEAPESHDGKLAYDMFWLMMDWEGRNALGVAPLKEITDRLQAVENLEQLRAFLTETPFEQRLMDPWTVSLETDPNNASLNILSLKPPTLMLQDSAEYMNMTATGTFMKETYAALLRKLLTRLGYAEEEAEQKIENCFAFETLLAQNIFTNEEEKSAAYWALSNNHVSREDLLAATGPVPLLETLEKADGYPEQDVYLVREPDFVKRLSEVWTEENLSLIRDYYISVICVRMASRLDRECYDWVQEFNSTITGSAGTKQDDIYFCDFVAAKLPWAAGRLYSDAYLKETDKVRITAMVEEILAAYHGILEEADWLSEETRAKAVEKLDAIYPRILYPDDWAPYSCEELNFASAQEGGTLPEALMKTEAYKRMTDIRRLAEPRDRTLWEISPIEVNCFYAPDDNSMYILGSFARGGIYNSDMTDEELYGKLGMVIGHEISHAFDSSGAQYDSTGNLKNWWTEEDMEAFQAKNVKLAEYFNGMHPWEGQNFYGTIMTGEACADMAGLKVVLQIAAGKEGFDYDRFFRAYADLWAEKMTAQMAVYYIKDEHPLHYLRINTVLQQYDEFLDYYGIREGDGMYLAPEARVNIW